MNIREVASLAGISVRTLHHYDRIGLLCPRRSADNDYREYSEQDLDRLQQILFFKTCGFGLSDIKELLCRPDFDREAALKLQKKHLLYEKKRIEAMLDTLNKTMMSMKGDSMMTAKEKFGGFDMSHNPYEEEARRLWGDKAVDDSKNYIESLTKDGQTAVAEGFDALFSELAALRHHAPDSDIAQQAMGKMFAYFNANFGVKYSPEAFAGVGQLYVSDERFRENVDKYGEGLSEFLAAAMVIYAEGRK